jgi:hypothetical protein
VGEGALKKEVTAWAVTGVTNFPVPVWADADNKFFGFSFFLSWLPEAYAGEHARLTEAQSKALAAQAPALAKSLVKVPQGAVAFTNVQVYDSEAKVFLRDQTVIVEKGLVAALFPSKDTKVPAGAQIIDGRGKTLLPGLWDCHMHVGNDYTGVQELSMGVTSIRDPGNDDSQTIDRRNRRAAGQLLFPHVYASSLIDGKGPYTAQTANVANSEAEAIALVDRAKANGFTGVKFYGTLNKDWLPAAAAEAHKQGLHVHGHIPVGLRTLDAIKAGYDEVTHINWIVMQAMPDSVINESNGIQRFEGPGRYAKDLDLNGKPITELISTMAAKGIYSDPTMVAFEILYVPDNGDLSPAFAPFVGTLPPATERGFRTGGFAVPKDLTRADYRASWAKMVELLGKMHKAGVPPRRRSHRQSSSARKRKPVPLRWARRRTWCSSTAIRRSGSATCEIHASSCSTAICSTPTRCATPRDSRGGRRPRSNLAEGRHQSRRASCRHGAGAYGAVCRGSR